MKLRLLLLLTGLSLSLTACQSLEGDAGISTLTPSNNHDHSIDNTPWQLTAGQIHGKAITILPNSHITLIINHDHIHGHSGVNTYQANLSSQGNTITIHDITTTRMASDPALMHLESDYLSALRDIQRYQLNGTQLTLSGDNAQLQFRSSELANSP